MDKFLIISILIIIIIYIVLLIVPPSINSPIFDLKTRIDIQYGKINTKKTIVNTMIYFITTIVIYYLFKKSIRNNPYYLIPCILLTILLSTYIVFFFSQHCALNLCTYNKFPERDLTNDKFINFIAIGDTQVSYNDTKKTLLKELNIELVKFINKFNDTPYNESDFIFPSYMRESDKSLFIESKKSKVSGVLQTGDQVHWPSDGRFLFTSDGAGTHEYIWPNNPTDGGLLKIPYYEVLGNHDLEGHDDWFRFDGDIMTNMLKNRIKYKNYVVNSDKYGNYSCDFGSLHVIFLAWSPFDVYHFHKQKNTYTIEFLENDLKIHGHKYFMYITHTRGRYFKEGRIYKTGIYDKNNPRMYDLMRKYGNKYIGSIEGHLHFTKTKIYFDYINKFKEKMENDPFVILAPCIRGFVDNPSKIYVKLDDIKLEFVYLIWNNNDNLMETYKVKRNPKNYKFEINKLEARWDY